VVRQRPQTPAELREVSGFSARKVTQLVTLLEEIGAVATDPDGRLRSPDEGPLPVDAARLALSEVERQQTVQRTRVDMMRQFAESRTCRGQTLLAYFGDRLDDPCGHCDNCDLQIPTGTAPAGPVARAVAVDPPRVTPRQRPRPAEVVAVYPLHSTVRHRSWGTGTVLGYDDDRMTVLFDSVGYKTLSVGVVRRQNLLVPE
jgi:ATP-dependent DNA helicase RecQ